MDNESVDSSKANSLQLATWEKNKAVDHKCDEYRLEQWVWLKNLAARTKAMYQHDFLNHQYESERSLSAGHTYSNVISQRVSDSSSIVSSNDKMMKQIKTHQRQSSS